MKLSVVIVNYNVVHFLEQALQSVFKAGRNLDMEVFVVDNNSVDNSVDTISRDFPGVKLIANKENVGFSRANNQAIRESKGQYILLLNPDTVLREDTLEKCCEFMDRTQDCGGLGVRMIDGKGKFLPESKRGLPTPAVAFYKMTGLSSIFPKSRIFGKYHLKYLPEMQTNVVDVLSGAFMMLRKSALDITGLLDETFFMYGEDIDLSYRITKAGFKNYYFPETTIIHYKGESTKKKSANYVRVFYHAMILFAQKHYSNKMAGWFAFFIRSAVWFRAVMALLWRLLSGIIVPVLDFILVYTGYFLIAGYWEVYNKYVRGFYPDEYYFLHIPGYILLVMAAVFISGGNDKPYSFRRINRGTFAGAVFLFAIYAFLPKSMQFSRAILALGSAWAFLAFPLVRAAVHFFKSGKFQLGENLERRIIIVAGENESRRIRDVLTQGNVQYDFIGMVDPGNNKPEGFLGHIAQIQEVAEIFRINHVIFSGTDVPAKEIMGVMSELSGTDIQFKIVPEKSWVVIGSNSKNDPGEFYSIDVRFALGERHLRRKKRFFDIALSVLIWVLFPLVILYPNGRKMLANSVAVFFGNKTWVSYRNTNGSEGLPNMKTGVFTPSQAFKNTDQELNSNLAYARDYSVYKDWLVVTRQIFARN